LKGDGWNWLIENLDWDWFRRSDHYEQIKREEEAFLNENGFTDLFEEFDVSYINVTDEVWGGEIADPIDIRDLV
jgi:hypothetical protein